jgi:hypothetical protein
MTPRELLHEIDERLEHHPGDDPWCCWECYHGLPCIDREILQAARKQLVRQE